MVLARVIASCGFVTLHVDGGLQQVVTTLTYLSYFTTCKYKVVFFIIQPKGSELSIQAKGRKRLPDCLKLNSCNFKILSALMPEIVVCFNN